MPDGKMTGHILSATVTQPCCERLWGTSLPGNTVWHSTYLWAVTPWTLGTDSSGSLFQAEDETTVSFIVQDWLFLLLWIISRSFPLSSASDAEMPAVTHLGSGEAGVLDPRLLTLAVIPGWSASPHYAGAQDVFVAEELSFIPLHRDALVQFPSPGKARFGSQRNH